MTRVLIVDDDAPHRAVMKRILESSGYETQGAADADAARARMQEGPPELALCDIRMPGESGLALAEDIVADWPATAVVMVSVADDAEIATQAMHVGADGFVVKPFTENEILIAVLSALKRREREQALDRAAAKNGQLLRRRETDLAKLDNELASAYEETVTRLSIAVETRDPDTSRHVHEMATHAWLIARQLGLPEERSELIRLAAPLHDIGKVGIRDAILLKPGKLTPEERTEMQAHAEMGSRILGSSRSKLIQVAATIAATHHERFDGTGYPRGLAGEDIPLEGRIAALADVFDALTRDRPYRKAMSTDDALELVTSERGKHFDPTVFDAFIATRDRKALLFAPVP
jgi:putative two-component system response regulator